MAAIGDMMRTTAVVDVRTQPGFAANEIPVMDPDRPAYPFYSGSAPAGHLGAVIEGPRTQDARTWWRVDFGPGKYAGWVTEDVLTNTTIPYVRGIDVSHWQNQINWTSVKNFGIQFAFMKATESTDFVDPRFQQNVTNARNAGVLVGFYHFANFPLSGDIAADARAEAAHFVETAGDHIRAPGLPPVLDLEVRPGVPQPTRATVSTWARAWMAEVQRLTGVRPMIYANSNWAKNYIEVDLAQYELWHARWTRNLDQPPLPTDPGIWAPNWRVWQYSSNTRVPGVAAGAPGVMTDVDGDVFRGTLADLQAWARTAVPDTIPPAVSGVSASPSIIARGQPLTIRWTATDQVAVDHVGLYLYQNGQPVDTRPFVSGGTLSGRLAANSANLPNTGSYTWTVPTSLPIGAYQFRVVAWNTAGVSSPKGPNAFSNMMITGSTGPDTYHVVRSGSLLQVYENTAPEGQPTYFSELAAMSGALTIDAGNGNDALTVNAGGQASLGLAQLNYSAGSGANSLVVQQGGARIDSTAAAGTLNTTVQTAAQLTTSRLNQSGLTVSGNGRVTLLAGGQTNVLTTLDLSPTGTLDLADNDLVIQSTAAAKPALLSTVSGWLDSGFADGLWNGPGISSTAAANPIGDTGLSLVDNALLGLAQFGGVTVDENALVLKYTYYGDIDLNGQVDGEDLTVFANNFGRTTGATQVDGDIDFNGRVDGEDLTVFANNVGKGIGGPLAAAPKYEGPATAGRLRTKDEVLSFPSSAWERTPAKLRFASAAEVAPLSVPTKQSPPRRAELGNQELTYREDEALVDLLAHAIASKTTIHGEGLADARLAVSRHQERPSAVWSDARWA